MTTSRQVRVLFEIIFLFIFPPLLIYLHIIPKSIWFVALLIMFLIIPSIVIKEKWSLKSLGIRLDNISSGLLPYTIFTILGVLVMISIAQIVKSGTVENWWQDAHFQFLFLPISFIQEFAYRSFLIPRLKNFTRSPFLIIFLNAILFSLLHIFYPNPMVNLPLTFVAGLGFAALYYRYPNLILITISHCILNFLAVYYCFVGFAHCRPM